MKTIYVVLYSLVLVSGGFAAPEPLVLVQPRSGMSLDGLVAQESVLRVTEDGMIGVEVGSAKLWPGVTIPGPNEGWDLSSYGLLEVTLRNPGQDLVDVNVRIDRRTGSGDEIWKNKSLRLPGGQSGKVTVDLSQGTGDTLDGALFGMRGYPVAARGGGADPLLVPRILVFLPKGTSRSRFELGRIAAKGVVTAPIASVGDAEPYFPLVDTLGQYRHRDWPGKAKSIEDMQARGRAEEAALEKAAGPQGWSRFGGWAGGPTLEATGFFRTAKHDGMWWLVDPDGHLFFSHGVDCVGADDVTVIEGRDAWFEDFPGKDPEFAGFHHQATPLKGHYAGKMVPGFSFARANLKRKYGDDWKARSADVIHRRMRAWGLNTIGNWSDRDVCALRRTPYTDTLGTGEARSIEGSAGYWRQFPDPFDPGFVGTLRKQMEWRKNGSANDPWCIGYFVDNELSWGDPRKLALSALSSPANQPAKVAFLEDLQKKYGSIAKLNAAWGAGHASWAALGAHRVGPAPERAAADLDAFSERLAAAYFRNVRDAIKEMAPKKLYLGCRFSDVNPLAARVAAEFCDVVSFNRYQRDIRDLDFEVGDKPVIIGEFHFGALDRGMFHTGLVPVANQAARAEAYRDYVRSALEHPNVVGTHWFKWSDEPVTGRFYDEENYQIGLVDVADTPYPETVRAVREIGDGMYASREGK